VTIAGQGELALLERIKPYLAAGTTGDDAAVVADATGFLVVSTDMYVEGVHFDLNWMTSEDAGWRSLALALGDLAAKGAEPAWVLSSLAMPKTWSVGALTGLYEGMHSLGLRYKLPIIGGDMSATEGPAVLSLTVAGRTEKMPLARAQARAGWSVGVTGPLGAAALALRERRPFRLEPRIADGRRVNALGLACGDISDGLVRELEKFQAMANVGFILEAADVPLADGVSIDEALTSGEEAELVCVGPEDVVRKAGLHVVGRSTAAPELIVVGSELETTGYDHFA
jgi:thiamine-monophosphate kinase